MTALVGVLVIQVFDDWIWLALILYIFMVAPQSRVPNRDESLLEVYEDMVEVLLVLEMFLT